jgi:hypothetical protein
MRDTDLIQIVVAYLLIGVGFGTAAMVVAEKRGGHSFGFFMLGLLLGPIGWLLAFTAGVPCPHCRQIIPDNATACRCCGQPIAPLQEQQKVRIASA